MRLNEAIIVEARFNPIDRGLFLSDKDRIVVYRKKGDTNNQIVQIVRKGKHEFVSQKGRSASPIATIPKSDRSSLDDMYDSISDEYEVHKNPSWMLILGSIASIPLLSAAIARLAGRNKPTSEPDFDPLSTTTMGLSSQKMKTIDPTIDVNGIPPIILKDIAGRSVNRHGYLDLNTFRHELAEFVKDTKGSSMSDRAGMVWDAIKGTIEDFF